MEMKRRIYTFLIVLPSLFIIDIVAAGAWFQVVPKDSESSPQKTDVAVVFMCDFGANGGIGEETTRRIDYAWKLYHGELTHKIVCVGGARPKRNIYGAENMESVLVSLGVPDEHVFSERGSNDSQSNWEAARKIIDSNNWHSISLVSSAVHLHRLHDIIVDEDLHIVYCPYPYDECHPEIHCGALWWQIHHEWLALVATALLPDSTYHSLIDWLRQ